MGKTISAKSNRSGLVECSSTKRRRDESRERTTGCGMARNAKITGVMQACPLAILQAVDGAFLFAEHSAKGAGSLSGCGWRRREINKR
jgi:hypothetical protein